MSCMGLVEHKLTIKATDDVYETTKKRATQLEKERKGVRYVWALEYWLRSKCDYLFFKQ